MWKPLHEAHAIDRVRVMVAFPEPVTAKALRSASAPVTSSHQEYGFDSAKPIHVQTNQIVIQIGDESKRNPGLEGINLQRYSGEEVVEDVAFTVGFIGYTTTEYGRWGATFERVQNLFNPVLGALSNISDISSIKLEYWDQFYFDGPPEEADALDLTSDVDLGVPKRETGPGRYWHSNCGWFCVRHAEKYLINRNFSVVERNVSDEKRRMTTTIHTLVEQRMNESDIDDSRVYEILNNEHVIANITFGELLAEHMRDRIGLNLAEYC